MAKIILIETSTDLCSVALSENEEILAYKESSEPRKHASLTAVFVKDVLDWYESHSFINPDGTLFTNVLSPMIYARVAEKYGFIYKDIDQRLDGGIDIYASSMFAGNKHEVTPRSRAVHLCAHSWHPTAVEKIRKWLKIGK